MAKYYVKITDEEPSDDEGVFWFELNSDNNLGKDELFVLARNEFTKLVEEFEEVQASYDRAYAQFNNGVVNEYIEPAIREYMEGMDDTVGTALQSTKLIDENEEDTFYTYSSLTSALNSKLNKSSVVTGTWAPNSNNPVSNKLVNDKLNRELSNKLSKSEVLTEWDKDSTFPISNKELANYLDSLKGDIDGDIDDLDVYIRKLNNDIGGKANNVHKHNSWSEVSFSKYGTIYYNMDLKMCFLTYYRKKVHFTANKEYVIHTIENNKYKPIFSTKLDCYNENQGALMNASGEFKMTSSKTGYQSMNVTGSWICKGE